MVDQILRRLLGRSFIARNVCRAQHRLARYGKFRGILTRLFR
jgi:hypothetical protein